MNTRKLIGIAIPIVVIAVLVGSAYRDMGVKELLIVGVVGFPIYWLIEHMAESAGKRRHQKKLDREAHEQMVREMRGEADR